MAQPLNSVTAILPPLTIAPAQVMRGQGIITPAETAIARLGQRPLLMGGVKARAAISSQIQAWSGALSWTEADLGPDCCEASLAQLRQAVANHRADVIIGVGGGKALDAAKLIAHQSQLPVVTIPTSAATCAAWTALSNVYTSAGAFDYDVPLPLCPNLLLLDYDLIATAPRYTLIAGIGDALAKWYEASVSSGHSQQTLIIAAVQQARVLRDILLQKSASALAEPGSAIWREVVDATVLMAGVIGGMGGAQCRTVAAHAVHNGLTHLTHTPKSLHGAKVAYGILVQLRLEEMLQGHQLAASSRQQLLKFYGEIGLPTSLAALGMAEISLSQLEAAAQIACAPGSDLHHLPFQVAPSQLMAAMISTTAPTESGSSRPNPPEVTGKSAAVSSFTNEEGA
jgi:glycerol dehydrogenase-like iron-containing ADH family enzyme